MELNTKQIETKWKRIWEEQLIYKIENTSTKPKYYVLDMFPYPSGAGLHVGHPLGYIASDIVARHKRMKGYHVLHPMGFDAFGLPAEQYAIQTGVHPKTSTEINIRRYKEQLNNIGFSYDWSREIRTSEPSYYKWTQWIFSQLFQHAYDTKIEKPIPITGLITLFEKEGNQNCHMANSQDEIFTASEWKNKNDKEKDDVLMNYRLAYRKRSYVNWCEALGTVLANDEIKDGVSERGGHPVEKKPMMQWVLRITAYAERLLNDLDPLEWSESLKAMQRNWIGKSTGAKVSFKVENINAFIEVFTTRPDTLFGVSFVVLAPEHEMISSLLTPSQKNEVVKYLDSIKNRTDRERQSETKSVTGVFTGSYAIHPFTEARIPIWISDYVLIEYGSGAIMGVPGNDLRDRSFALKFELPILQVIDQSQFPNASVEEKVGQLIHSSFLNGLDVQTAITKIIDEIQIRKMGTARIQYKMRDANFSRQRYWGEPYPILYDKEDVSYLMDANELPVILPDLEKIEPGKGGKSPLSNLEHWVHAFPNRIRETDTMPGYAGSSWYFLRYMDANNDEVFASKEAMQYWRDVDLYIGGTEHAVGHLMYSRFWHKFLYDLNYVPTIEPFKKLVNQGMIQGVIESILLLKNSKPATFVDAKIINQFTENDISKIPVHIDFITDYNTPNSHLTKTGIQKFLQWIPEYINAKFQAGEKSLSFDELPEDYKIYTSSEVGKMSKRYHNVVNPDDVVAEYGADCFRMYEMFLGPLEQSKPWDTKGISGVSNFLKRYYSLFWNGAGEFILSDENPSMEELRVLHQCIKKINSDIENLSFNTAVSAFMICVNELKKMACNKKSILLTLTKTLAPFAPFITDEIWFLANEKGTIHHTDFPECNEEYLISHDLIYPISINGKKRHEWLVSKDKPQDELNKEVIEIPEIKKWIDGQPIKKIIIVKDRMINIVI